jgi:hypothetical protein
VIIYQAVKCFLAALFRQFLADWRCVSALCLHYSMPNAASTMRVWPLCSLVRNQGARLALATTLYFVSRNGHPTPAHQERGAQVKLTASLPYSTTTLCLYPAKGWHRLGTEAKPLRIRPPGGFAVRTEEKWIFVLSVTGAVAGQT